MKRRDRPRAALQVEELEIESLAIGGAAVTRSGDGTVVFVHGAAPGERVRVAVDASTRPARGRLLAVLEPSPRRVTPACAHVDRCGGCDWMFLSAEAQEEAHAELVRAAIAHTCPGAALPEVRRHAAPRSLGYRARARLHARVDRGRARVGYNAASSHDLVEVAECVVLDPAIAPVLEELPALLQGATGHGEIGLARGAGGLPVVDMRWRGDLGGASWSALDAKVTGGRWAGARVLLDGASKPAAFGDPRPRMVGADDAPLAVAAGGFSQPSDESARALARRVAELALPDEPRHVLELFAGSGTLSILLAPRAQSFAAVEIDADAAACARENLAARGLAGKVTVADADAFAIPPRAEVVVLDPPRAGAPGASRAVAASRARRVIYVACDVASLARDLGTLTTAGFRITAIETFELFPQTSHVETVVAMLRSRP